MSLLCRACVAAAIMLTGTLRLQEVHSSPIDSRMQISAASLAPALRRRWLYADNRLVVGRVQDVRVSADGNTLMAIVARRRWLGGGEITIPVPLLRQTDNDLTINMTPKAIRSMPAI